MATTTHSTQQTAASSGKATAGFVLGIFGVLTAIIPILGLILGVVATALSASAKGDIERRGLTNKWAATTGLVLGIIAIALAVVLFAVGFALSS